MAGTGLAVALFLTAGHPPAGLGSRASPRQRLLAAFGDSHLVGVRVTGIESPAPSAPQVTMAEQRAIAREIEASARKDPTPQSLGNWGLLQLAVGRYEAAVEILERAVRWAPADSGLRADLTAAYLARGRALEMPRDQVHALDRLRPNPAPLESTFNRALALQSLYLHRLAMDAWEQYIQRDPDSPWSRIASKHLRTLLARERSTAHAIGSPGARREGISEPPVRSSHPEDLQVWIDKHGLPQWTSAVLAGDGAGRRSAEEDLRQAAARLVELGGDRLATDEVKSLVAARGGQQISLAKGLRDYAEARDLLDRYAFEKARVLFNRASERFKAARSPRLWWAETGMAHCEFQLKHYVIAHRRAEQILWIAHRRSYAAIEARCAWILAGIGLATLDLDSAQRHAATCLEINHRARNRSGAATASLTLARVYDELGDSTSAWLHRLRGFRDLAENGSDEPLALAIGNASFALAREGEFHAAADFASEALAFDRQQGTALGLAESLWMRAMHRAKGGDAKGALADVHEAESYLSGIDSTANRARLRAGLRAVEGALQAERQPLVAIAHLDDALGFLRQSGYEYGQAEALIDRSRAMRQLGRFEDALLDLEKAARIVSRQRGRIREPVLRVSFFDLQAELADERVATSLRIDPTGEHAFWAADEARGLLFRESLALAPLRTAAVNRSFPWRASQIGDTDAILSYWSLPDELLIWIVRRDQPLRLVRRSITRTELSQQISGFVAAIQRGAEASKVSSRAQQLGTLLIAPFAAELSGVSRLIVIPDRVVRAVPWPVLEAGHGEGLLLRRFVIRICPAVGTLAGAEGILQEPSSVRLLAIGAPEATSSQESAFVSLPGARSEIEGIARLFSNHLTLTGRAATRENLFAALKEASILHVASHFLVGRNPGSARIVLARGAGEQSGSLDAEEIAHLSLPRLRLAVLSGCATSREGRPTLEGTFAAAGSFLAAGATETVATQWPVNDRVTVDLITHFYRELLAGHQADESLRRAQIALLDGTDRAARKPAHWAAFQVVSLRPNGQRLTLRKEKM